MQPRINEDSTNAGKALRLYQKLLLDGRRHFQTDLAQYLGCSVQTVMRLIVEIESVIGACLLTGLEKHRRWYQIRSISRNMLGLDFEELRYLAICRDLAAPFLPEEVKARVDKSIFNFSMLMSDPDYAEREKIQKKQLGYCAKGWIDYAPYFAFLEKLVVAMDEKKICLVRYKPVGHKKIKEHRFAADRIVCMNNALYVLGASLTENWEIRFLLSLAVHRIKDVTLTDRTYNFNIPRENLDMFGLPWHEPKKFRIRFKTQRVCDYVHERVWSEKQNITRLADDDLLLEMESCSEPEVIAWVRSFGDDAELLNEEAPEQTPL